MEQQYCRKKRKRLRYIVGTRNHLLLRALMVLLLSIPTISGDSSGSGSSSSSWSSSGSSSPLVTVADIWRSLASKARRDLQESKAIREMMEEAKGTEEAAGAMSDVVEIRRSTRLGMSSKNRRKLGGPGSSPPRCTGKCDKCIPCKPVQVPVPPGTPVTAEYYPEAWRCECGNKLFMP